MDKYTFFTNNNDMKDMMVVDEMNKNKQNRLHGANDEKFLPIYSIMSGIGQEVLSDIYCYTNQIVNIVLIGDPEVTDDWMMVDTGMPKSSSRIRTVVKERFGENNPPQAIILTHGHPVKGQDLSEGLEKLLGEFAERAIPDYGKYVN